MDKFCEILKNQASEIINSEQKKMLPVKIEELELYKSKKVCYISEEQIF